MIKVKFSMEKFQERTEKMESQLRSEFDSLTTRNIELEVHLTLLNQRLLPLQDLERQAIGDEDSDVKAVLMEESDVIVLIA